MQMKTKLSENVMSGQTKKKYVLPIANNFNQQASDSSDSRAGDINKIIESFHIESGPEYVCFCCSQLLYKSSLKKLNID